MTHGILVSKEQRSYSDFGKLLSKPTVIYLKNNCKRSGSVLFGVNSFLSIRPKEKAGEKKKLMSDVNRIKILHLLLRQISFHEAVILKKLGVVNHFKYLLSFMKNKATCPLCLQHLNSNVKEPSETNNLFLHNFEGKVNYLVSYTKSSSSFQSRIKLINYLTYYAEEHDVDIAQINKSLLSGITERKEVKEGTKEAIRQQKIDSLTKKCCVVCDRNLIGDSLTKFIVNIDRLLCKYK